MERLLALLHRLHRLLLFAVSVDQNNLSVLVYDMWISRSAILASVIQSRIISWVFLATSILREASVECVRNLEGYQLGLRVSLIRLFLLVFLPRLMSFPFVTRGASS